ncbi:RagB/SusD family nutrient uptake outer membrane protein [Sphingobacterium paucimobilis]|uniref:RagB/SusD family nutrient uptake outer membrane protein n=1 Tax=Sphingobacterium paucimobilis HER1398 TaxID=1346330 RepID=U2HTW5_9SPHI|nr:RagB/SusD family nutrient uptake outer membrane protein [Sphingobacterium paucimobilis]ERJ58720.1 hypothetical protein M472_08060 [Sphingobacterium paucimobilis HER1398]
MKKTQFYILIAAAMCSTLGACSAKLDLYPSTGVSPDAITEKDLPALRLGMYNEVQNAPGAESYILFDLLGGDLHTASGNPIDLINSILSPLNSVIANNWNGYYKAIYQVNNMIAVGERFGSSQARNIALGEAHYFRAYIYYSLITRWGAVPILRQNTLEKVSRNPENEVWDFIEEDLNTAEGLLGTSTNYYYVSRDAATALKARVKLNQGKMGEAAELAESLIKNGKYKLDSFEKIFRKLANTEVIFAFENLSEESSNNISDLFYTYAHTNKGQGKYRVFPDMLNAFSTSDKRRAISIVNISGTDCINKYPSGQTGRDPVILSRIAEMYLISAEAQGRVNGLSRLNELRAVRGLSPVAFGSDTDYLDAIIKERRLEFLGENMRYNDLTRTDKAIQTLHLLPHQTVLPIPGRELQNNTNITPNEGY